MRSNIERVALVAERLGELRNRFVFVGGAATELLITDPAAPPIRVTQDVDVVVNLTGRPEFYELEEKLRKLGFRNEGSMICRWSIDEVMVDIMPTDSRILGFANRWYTDAIRYAVSQKIPSGLAIRVVTAPLFVATKFEAHLDRGAGDLLASHDLGDIISLLDGREELEGELAASPSELRDYVRERFREFAQHHSFLDALAGHLPGDLASQERALVIEQRIRRIAR